ncbi:hypothetical protein ABR737_19765 [Streptomyces sp. Edi2]
MNTSNSHWMRPPLAPAPQLLHHCCFEDCLCALSVRQQRQVTMIPKRL